ncbi:MAG: SCO family protein [Anaerolineae bacterium]
MRYKIIILFALMLAASLTACRPYEYHGTILNPPREVQDFTLEAHTGQPLSLSDYRGHYVLIYFGYTYCPDFCPATMYQLAQAVEALGEDASGVQVIMVTVDPARDTAEQLSDYVTGFNSAFLGARTDDPQRLAEIASDFGVFYETEDVEGESAAGYLVSHTVSLFLIDREGRMLGVYPFGVTGEDLAADLRHLIRQD